MYFLLFCIVIFFIFYSGYMNGIILLNVLNILMFGWWIVYMIVLFVFVMFFIVCMMMVVVFVFKLDVGLFMNMIEGLDMSLIVIVSCFCCFVESLFIFGILIKVFFILVNLIVLSIWLMNFCKGK